jgi:hypothetical protein
MIWPYLGFYWSVYPHLLLDICLFELCAVFNPLMVAFERLVSVVFWLSYGVFVQ